MVITIGGISSAQTKRQKIGITLHPYYSWVKNIVSDVADVVPVLPPEADPHSYQLRPMDMKKLESLDAIVVNGLGHDEFIKQMIKASGREDLPQINPHRGLPLIPIFSQRGGQADAPRNVAFNSHTFISITLSIAQIHNIAEDLGKLDPAHEKLFRDNARIYVHRLRRMLGAALARLNAADLGETHIATVHDGYAYLMNELGLEIVAVIQPRHGIEPNPRQLQDTIDRIKKAKVNILFAEADYGKKYVDIIFQETGCRIFQLSHISHGQYSMEFFEKVLLIHR